MLRLLIAVIACLAATCAVALARPASEPPATADAAGRTAHRSAAGAARRLGVKAAKRPIGKFLASATQVTGLPRSYRVGPCRRRSTAVVDCTIAVPGHASGTMRARLFGGSRPRIQLYVLAITPTR